MTARWQLQAWLAGVGFIAPGVPDWTSAAAMLTGTKAWQNAPSVLPPPALLPPAERRRASRVVRLALAVGLQAVAQAQADASRLATVFAASGADGHNCHALCEQLASDDRLISPTRFHNSVHNVTAGYWSIATRSMAPCQVVCAHDGSFGAGLMDALTQVASEQQPVLLVAYDSEYPEPLHAKRPLPDAAGVACLLVPGPSATTLAELTVTAAGDGPLTTLDSADLEALRQQFPALRAMPVLAALARQQNAAVVVEYLPAQALGVQVRPC